jgi:hypothetical protein
MASFEEYQATKAQPQNASPNPARLLTPRARSYAIRQKRQIGRLEREAQHLNVSEKKERYRGFWWALDQIDRPRNAAHNMILQWMNGERDPAQLVEHGWKGLRGNERAAFEQIIERMGTDTQMALLTPLTMLGLDKYVARKVAGLGGDILLDPLNFIPAKILGNAATKAFRIAIKGVEGEKTLAKGGKVLRDLIVRGSGIPQLDKLQAKAIDDLYYIRSGLSDQALQLHSELKSLRTEHKGLVSKLAEETHWNDVNQFADLARQSQITPQGLQQALTGHQRFRNPEAVRQFIAMRDPETVTRVIRGVEGLRALTGRARNLEAATGKVVPELGGTLTRKAQKIQRAFNKTVRDLYAREEASYLAQIRGMEQQLHGRAQGIKDILGKERMSKIQQAIRRAGGDSPMAKLGRGGINTADIERVLRRYLDEIAPTFIDSMEGVSKDQAAIQSMWQRMTQVVTYNTVTSPKVQDLVQKYQHVLGLMDEVPVYVPHVGSQEFIERLSDLEGQRHWIAAMRNPRTSADITRKFAIEGRPLSFEEIEKIVKGEEAQGGIKGLYKEGIIYKRQGLGERIVHKPREVADFFNTDERIVTEALAQRTARSVSTARYLNKASQHFSKTADSLTAAEKKYFLRFEDLDGGKRIVATMPHLRERYFDPEVLSSIIKTTDAVELPQRVVKYYDSMLSWWKSYQLGLFPQYHTRNGFGNLVNMTHAGFLDDPRDFADGLKASALQMMAWRKNQPGMAGLRFLVKNVGPQPIEITGDEVIQLALRNGVINSGWFGGDLAGGMAQQLDRTWKTNLLDIIPGRRTWHPVRGGMALGTAVENNARLTLFVNRLRKGDSAFDAAAKVKKFLGDYRGEIMTPFEKNVLARTFPFYRWSRFNVPLQFEQLLTNNRARMKTLAFLRGARALGPEEDFDLADLPDWVPQWIREGAGVPVRRDEQGQLQFLLFEGWHPAADIDNFLSARSVARFMVNQATPPVSRGIEFALGRSLFLDRELRGHRSEFLGQVMDAEMVNNLRTIRLLAELDRLDPFGSFHVSRRLGQKSEAEQALRPLGLTVQTINPAREMLRSTDERIDKLKEDLSITKSYLSGKKAQGKSRNPQKTGMSFEEFREKTTGGRK